MIDETSRLAQRSHQSAVITGGGAVVVLAALVYAGLSLAKLDRLYEGTEKELDAGFEGHSASQGPVEALKRESVLSAVQGRRKEALQLAFDLYDKRAPFKWGGKTPSDGLDTSGFVAYILSRVGVLDRPERFWSGLLLDRFRAPVSSTSELLPGDLIFEENRACWFVLSERYTIGMVPGGVVIGEPARFSSNIIGYGRVPYDRPDSTQTR